MIGILPVAAPGSPLPPSARDSGILLAMTRWLGVDVGGARKGHDVAVVDDRRLLELGLRDSPDP